MNNFFTLNAATYEDEKLLFDWINDIDVRRWSFNQNKILLNDHKTWFNNKINDNKDVLVYNRNLLLECRSLKRILTQIYEMIYETEI